MTKLFDSNMEAFKSVLSNIEDKFDDIVLNDKDVNEVQEWINCQEDFFYYLFNYVSLDLPGNDNKFHYHIGQELSIRTLMEFHYAIVVKSRQIGITTVIRAYCSWLTIFYSNYSIGVISKKGPDATAFVRKTIDVLLKLPDFLKPTFSKKTEQQYILDNGSSLMAEAVSPSQPENTLRSNPITFLIIDEAAFVCKIKEALTGLLPTTVTAQMAAKKANIPYGVFIISTPNKTTGNGEWFFKEYKQAVLNNGLSDALSIGSYKALKLHWKMLGGIFTQEWYDTQCKVQNYREDDIAQEVDCVFLPNVKNGLIKKENIIPMNNAIREPDYKIKVKEFGQIYCFDKTLKETRDNRRFVVTVDTATSNGMSTFSTIEAIDYDTDEQVLEYIGKLSTYDYPKVIRRALEELGNNLFIIIERNTIGESIVEEFSKDPIYRSKIFWTIKKDKKNRIVKRVPGIETHGRNKPLFLEAVTDYFNENPNRIFSERAILQITTVEVKNGQLYGTPNDTIMCFAFYSYLKRNNKIKFNNFQNKDFKDMETELGKASQADVLNYLYDKNPALKNRIQRNAQSNLTLVELLNKK